MKSLITTLLLITGISMAQSEMPSVPQTTSFQAVITDTLGVPLEDGTKTFTFRMEKPTDTGSIIAIWEETQEVEVVNGVISVVLGIVTPLNPIPFTGFTFQNTTYNLIVTLDGEDISVIPLTSVPFALNASRTNYAANAVEAEHAVLADTAHFVMTTPMSDTSGFAHEAGHSVYTDTSVFTHQSHTSTYADTANYVNLSNYNYLIRAVKDDDASVVAYSTGPNSASYLGLVSQTSEGIQRELRIMNEGNNDGGFRFYDASNNIDLMVLDTTGSLTATKFVGDGSELTDITITNFGVTATATELNIMDGVTATTAEINYIDGVTWAIQTQMDGKQPLDPDLTDLSDGTLSASLVEHGSYFVSSAGTIGQIWTSDGQYAGAWVDPYATTLADLDLTATAAELNIMDGVTATNVELNIIDGVTATTAELNYVSGVSSAIQTQMDGKQPLDSDLTDLSDGTLSSSLVEHGSYFIPSAGTSGQVWTSDGAGAGAWASTAITTLPTLDVTATAAELNIMDGVTATAAEINYVDGVTSAVQTQLDAKQATVTGAGSSIVTDNLTASRAVIAGANGKVAVSDVTSAELDYVDGVTSAIQTQLDGKQALDADLTDLADGTLSASLVENGSYFISSAGVSGRVWTSDGAGAGAWVASTAASELGGLSDALIETNSMYIGNDPASTTNTAQYNLAVGVTALDAITTGDNNVAVGYNVLTANTTGGGNTALGSSALKANTGSNNTAVGFNALLQNTSGGENTAIGDGALYTNTTGEKNNAMGRMSLRYNVSGDNNMAAGHYALYANTTGSNNTALGYQAGNVITNGNSNVILGSNADPGDAGGTNQIVIGYGATGHGDNIAVIGNGSLLAIHPTDDNEVDLGSSTYEYKDLYVDGTANVDALNLDGTAVTATAAELNIMDGVTATAVELNIIDGVTATTAELNYVDGVTSAVQTQLDAKQALDADLTDLADGTLTATLVQYGSLFITSAGTSGQVWTSDGTGVGGWGAAATAITGLSDALVEDNSMYIGNDPASTTSTASYNIAIGTTALDAITTGDKIVAVGYDALTANTEGHSNTAAGYQALRYNTTGDRNIAIGYGALNAPDTENDNLAIGYSALGGSIALGEYNVAIGNYSLDAATSGDNNTATGYDALTGNTTGADNTALGYDAGDVITTGSQNVIIGSGADPSANSGANQIVIGYGATGHGDNIAVIGNGSATAIHPHDDNEVDLGSSSYEYKNLYVDGVAYADAIGFGTVVMELPTADGGDGQVLKTDGSGNLDWATPSSVTNVTGLSDALVESNSMYIGNDPASTTSSAEKNVAIGITALDAITTGDNNVAVGYDALTANTEGSYNTASGYRSLYANTTGSSNTASGYGSLNSNTTGSRNISIGHGALDVPDTENDNLSIGYDALGGSIAGGEYNVAVGNYSLDATTSGDNNTATGYDALTGNTSGADNTALGYDAGDVIGSGSQNVIIGSGADPSANSGANQIVIGYGATGHGDNIAVIGNGSATAIHPHDDDEVDLGSSTYEYKNLYVDGVAYADAIGFGTVVMTLPTTDGSSGQVLQTNAGGTLSWATRSTTTSVTGLSDALVENNSMYIGNDPSSTNSGDNYNVAVGVTALDAITSGDNNVAIGYDALTANTTAGNNTAIGYQAGDAIVDGANNTTVGYQAGDVITDGANNVIIGSGADPSASGGTNQIAIGYGATGTGNNGISLGNTSISSIKGQVAFSTYSDVRIKRDIHNSDLGLAFINKLRPVKYALKNPVDYPLALLEKRFTERNDPRPEDNETVHDGLIAQEVKAAMDELGIEWSGWSINESDGKQGLQYGALTVPLIKAVQEQQDQIEDLKMKDSYGDNH